MRDEILDRLDEIERSDDVRILFACESGSRAWGFASPDSDYDVRFVYVRRRERYLVLDEPRDVIERPIEGMLDINGWDLRKVLRQLRRSNPVMTEWLDSPIVYRERMSTAKRLRDQIPAVFRPAAAWHHYLSMARRTIRTDLAGESVALKKYFYALRPMFAVNWIERGFGPVPMEFRDLLARMEIDASLHREIDRLLELKSKSGELGRGPRIEPISRYLETALIRAESIATPVGPSNEMAHELDRIFAESVDQGWN